MIFSETSGFHYMVYNVVTNKLLSLLCIHLTNDHMGVWSRLHMVYDMLVDSRKFIEITGVTTGLQRRHFQSQQQFILAYTKRLEI